MKYKLLFTMTLAIAIPSSAEAGLFAGAGKLNKMMTDYVGRPAQDLVDVIGYPNDQKQVLDDVVLFGGFDSEEGPSCTWKIVADKDRIIKNVSTFGNSWGCGMIIKSMKKAIKEKIAGKSM